VRRLHFAANSEPATVLQVETFTYGVYVLLFIGRISGDRLTVVTYREDGSVLGVSMEKTSDVPPVMATLSLEAYGEVQFIPRNREALVNVSHIAGMGELVPVTVPGAYTVTRSPEGYRVRGVNAAGGYTSLRFAYRIAREPASFADTDFGEIVDPLQRPIREASMPAPIQVITYIVPARYFIVALRSILLKGAELSMFWQDLAALAVYAAFMLMMASRRLRSQWT